MNPSPEEKRILVSITLYCNSTYKKMFDIIDKTTEVKKKGVLNKTLHYSKKSIQAFVENLPGVTELELYESDNTKLNQYMSYVNFPKNFKNIYYNDKSHFGLITEKKEDFIPEFPNEKDTDIIPFFFENEYENDDFNKIIESIKKNATELLTVLNKNENTEEESIKQIMTKPEYENILYINHDREYKSKGFIRRNINYKFGSKNDLDLYKYYNPKYASYYNKVKHSNLTIYREKYLLFNKFLPIYIQIYLPDLEKSIEYLIINKDIYRKFIEDIILIRFYYIFKQNIIFKKNITLDQKQLFINYFKTGDFLKTIENEIETSNIITQLGLNAELYSRSIKNLYNNIKKNFAKLSNDNPKIFRGARTIQYTNPDEEKYLADTINLCNLFNVISYLDKDIHVCVQDYSNYEYNNDVNLKILEDTIDGGKRKTFKKRNKKMIKTRKGKRRIT